MGAGLRRDAHRVGLPERVGLTRRLSQRISEGDGIAIIVRVGDADAARVAQAEGAKALAVDRAIEGLRGLTSLPVLWLAGAVPVDADAIAIRPNDEDGSPNGLETVMEVRDEEELETALEEHDPEIFLISPSSDDETDPLEHALELLPDVPAGKLAIADVDVGDRDEVLQLERAGFDAVLVAAGSVGSLVGESPPDV